MSLSGKIFCIFLIEKVDKIFLIFQLSWLKLRWLHFAARTSNYFNFALITVSFDFSIHYIVSRTGNQAFVASYLFAWFPLRTVLIYWFRMEIRKTDEEHCGSCPLLPAGFHSIRQWACLHFPEITKRAKERRKSIRNRQV